MHLAISVSLHFFLPPRFTALSCIMTSIGNDCKTHSPVGND